MGFDGITDEQLEFMYKQAEGANPINFLFLKEMRFEMYARGIAYFHGISFEEARKNNPALAAEYDEWCNAGNK